MSISKYNNRLTIDEWYNKLYDLYFDIKKAAK